MILSNAKAWMASGILAIPLAAVGACNAANFSADQGAGSGGSAGYAGQKGSAGGSLGSGATYGKAGSGGSVIGQSCAGPEDCNDDSPCTIDVCGGDGHCASVPKCSDGMECCPSGDCGECCSNEDCNDGIECTSDICFAASCTHVPSDEKCGDDQYCAMADGCRLKEPCSNGAAEECDDANLCTVDSCSANLCQHVSCGTQPGVVCCEEFGCGECCVDSQCDDDKACTRDICTRGQCSHVPLCPAGLDCCESADRSTATCGSCCSAADCQDAVDCTDDSCVAGECHHTPNAGHCEDGETCVAATGCELAGSCQSDADCDDKISCTDDSCRLGSCMNVPNNGKCGQGQTCSVQYGKCIECTTSVQCDDLSECTTDSCVDNKCVHTPDGCGATGRCCGNVCKPECCSAYDCGTVDYIIPDGGGIELCSYTTCDNLGYCQYLSTYCNGQTGVCCPYSGCSAFGCEAI